MKVEVDVLTTDRGWVTSIPAGGLIAGDTSEISDEFGPVVKIRFMPETRWERLVGFVAGCLPWRRGRVDDYGAY